MLSDLNEDQREIRDLVRRLLASQPVGGTTEGSSEQAARAAWSRLSGELGVGALTIPEEFEGLGLGFLELAAVLTECGRTLTPAPVLSSGLAVTALLLSDAHEVRADWLPRLAAGAIGTVALAEDDDDWFAAVPATRARPAGPGWLLDGERLFVPDAQLADVIVVPAGTDDGPGVFLVPTDQAGVTVTPMRGMDLSRDQARIELRDAQAFRLDSAGFGARLLEGLRSRAMVALAAEQLGTAERALEMAVEYAGTRHQFGRPIGSFQAIKHHCADMLVAVERMRSIVQHAVWAVETDAPRLPQIASTAKAICSEAVVYVTHTNVQVHGGIGFTWEHDAHRYVRRAKSTEAFLGLPEVHRTRVGDWLLTLS